MRPAFTLSDDEKHILMHSLGFRSEKDVFTTKEPYRNYFAAGKSGKDRETIEQLVERGYMIFGGTMNDEPNTLYVYHVTMPGRACLRDNTPRA